MTARRLPTYLKAYRKRSSLTQREVAFLLGWKEGDHFSRYEKRRVRPSLRVALGCAVIFRVSVKELFPGVCDPIAGEVAARIERLRAELEKKQGNEKEKRLTARKLSWIIENHGPSNSNQ
jgi:transcriptional regulator with XRE-family HTH domain